MKASYNIQDHFLNQLRKEMVPTTVFLVRGFKFVESSSHLTTLTVIVESEGRQQLIYKHAISTFSPARNVTFLNQKRLK